MNYLLTCTSRLVVHHLYQVSFKSMQGCRRSWEDKLWCDGRTEWRKDGMTEWRTKQTLNAPLPFYGGGIKIFQAVLCPTQLFQWKLICTFNQHCLSYQISNRLQFNSSLFSNKLFKILLRWHTFFQHVPHIENTFIHTNTYAYVFCWSV